MITPPPGFGPEDHKETNANAPGLGRRADESTNPASSQSTTPNQSENWYASPNQSENWFTVAAELGGSALANGACRAFANVNPAPKNYGDVQQEEEFRRTSESKKMGTSSSYTPAREEESWYNSKGKKSEEKKSEKGKWKGKGKGKGKKASSSSFEDRQSARSPVPAFLRPTADESAHFKGFGAYDAEMYGREYAGDYAQHVLAQAHAQVQAQFQAQQVQFDYERNQAVPRYEETNTYNKLRALLDDLADGKREGDASKRNDDFSSAHLLSLLVEEERRRARERIVNDLLEHVEKYSSDAEREVDHLSNLAFQRLREMRAAQTMQTMHEARW